MTLLLAALAAASTAFWVLKWPAPGTPMRAAVPSALAPPIDSSKLAQLLGASPKAGNAGLPAPANTLSKYKLLGLIAQGAAGNPGLHGSALIAIEGKPAKPYRVGDTVSDDWLLQSVAPHSVVLARNGQTQELLTLDLPMLSVISFKNANAP